MTPLTAHELELLIGAAATLLTALAHYIDAQASGAPVQRAADAEPIVSPEDLPLGRQRPS